MAERILDLGIGYGGEYLPLDTWQRIGFDVRDDRLGLIKNKFGIDSVVGDVGQFLPFCDNSFSKVQCFFPTDELLLKLTEDSGILWDEISRVLKPSRFAEIYFESNAGNKRKVIFGPEVIEVNPLRMIKIASQKGFRVKTAKLNDKDISKFMTSTLENILELEPQSVLWKIRAEKLSQKED